VFRIRFFEKKRGEHRTMSETGSRVALAAFFVVLAVAGAAVLAAVLGEMTIAEWRANHEFMPAKCTILAEKLAQVDTEGRIKYRPEFKIRYSAGGREIETTAFDPSRIYQTDEEEARRELADFAVGRDYPCWYDPQNPATVVLKRGYSWYAWLIPLLPAAFIAVGVGGLIFLFFTWGKSVEHRALLQQVNLDLFDQTRAATPRFPTVPDDAGLTNSAGTTLRYRVQYLPPIGSLLLTAMAVLWNGAMVWFIWRAAAGFWSGGNADSSLSPMLIPFVAAGGYLAYLAGRGVLVALGIEPTVVEVSEHPLFPGGKYDLFVSQSGRHQFRRFTVVLVCDEEATFRQGTNSRTHSNRTAEVEIFRREAFSTDRQTPLAARFDFRIPVGAMHSFQGTHNSIKWKLLVRASLHKWPDFEREFSIVVAPAPKGGPLQ
jgi:hypothetical protein